MRSSLRATLAGSSAVLLLACAQTGPARERPDGRPGTELSGLPGLPGPNDRPFTAGVGQDIGLPPEVRRLAARVSQGATLASLLHAHDIAEREIITLVSRVAGVFDVRGLRSDRPYRIVQAIGGALRRFEYDIDNDRVLTVARDDEDDFVAAIDAIPKRTEVAQVSGAIDRESPSLFAAMSRTGEGVELAVALADTLSSEVDFNTELQPGDRFGVLFEKEFRDDPLLGAYHTDPNHLENREPAAADGGFTGYGAVQAAELVNAGRTIRAIRFTPTDGAAQYFDEQGRSLKRFLLKSPLKFDPVVTSPFSGQRLHPVLGFHRAHLGVDYRAAIGAPVVAVADGTVVFAGFSGGAGRMVHLRHANGIETQYLHLSAARVVAGSRVRQGEVIGKVGATGLATGPHLDYRIRKDGTFVNPVAVHRAMPPGDPIVETDRPAFEAVRDRILPRLHLGN